MELNGKKKVCTCRLCPQPCSTAWNLKIHIQRKHHWKGESVKSGLMTNTTRQFTPDTRNSIKHNSYSDTSHYRNHHKAYHQPYGFSEGSSRNEETETQEKRAIR